MKPQMTNNQSIEKEEMSKDKETHTEKQKKRDMKNKAKEETKEEEKTNDNEVESTNNKRKYVFKRKDLMQLTEVSNFTMDDFVNCLMMKYTNDLKLVNKHKNNSNHFEKIKKINFSLLNRVKESFIAIGNQLSKGIIEGKKPIAELDFYLQNEIKKRNIDKVRSIIVPWLLSEIKHWILIIVDLKTQVITILDSLKNWYKKIKDFEKNIISFLNGSNVIQYHVLNYVDTPINNGSIEKSQLNFTFKEGKSLLQFNEFDWGIFTMLNMYCIFNFIDQTKVHYNDIKIRKLIDIFIDSKGTSNKLEDYLNESWEDIEIITRKINFLSSMKNCLKTKK